VKQRFVSAGSAWDIEIAHRDGALIADVNGGEHAVEILSERPGTLTLRVDGATLVCDWAADRSGGWICHDGRVWRFDKPHPTASRRREATGTGEGALRSPMPALVVAIDATEGQDVEGGAMLLVLEAMKMETRVTAPAGSWTVKRLLVAAGQQVIRDQELLELAPRDTGVDAEGGEDDGQVL